LSSHWIWNVFALVLCVQSWAWSASTSEHRALCSGLKRCLSIDLPSCSAEDKTPNPDLQYKDDVCPKFQDLENRGIDPLNPGYATMFSYLGGSYRVQYSVGGVLPVNADMMAFLMDNMPFTARLINAYQETNYSLHYVNNNKHNIMADNGRSLKGEILWLRSDSSGHLKGHRNTFWCNGSAKVLMWQLHGMVVVFLDYDPIDQNQIRYRLHAIVFPANAFLNSVMNMDMFRDVVMDKMKFIVNHVEGSARAYAQGNRKPIQNATDFQKVPWMREKLGQFEYVVQKSGYGQKVWPPRPKVVPPPSKPSQIWNPVGPIPKDTAAPTLLMAPKSSASH